MLLQISGGIKLEFIDKTELQRHFQNVRGISFRQVRFAISNVPNKHTLKICKLQEYFPSIKKKRTKTYFLPTSTSQTKRKNYCEHSFEFGSSSATIQDNSRFKPQWHFGHRDEHRPGVLKNVKKTLQQKIFPTNIKKYFARKVLKNLEKSS